MTYAIIGFGISGMIVYLELLKRGILANQIQVFDSDFIGGDLAKYYYDIESNTTWEKVTTAYPDAANYYPHLDFTKTTNLHIIPKTLQQLVKTHLPNSECHLCTVEQLSYKDGWTIATNAGSYKADHLFLCQGGLPKQIDLPAKQLPLHIALNKDEIKKHVDSTDTVVVFGLAHSGTLILKHLVNANVKQIIGIYKTPTPFQYNRDGHYSGIKQESAEIADAIQRGDYPSVKLIHTQDTASIARAIRTATLFISAIGFNPRKLKILVNDEEKDSMEYDPETAKLEGVPNCHGFGMAYPGVTKLENKVYPDVSVASFQEQIARVLRTVS